MPDKSTDPNDPNYDPHLANLRASLIDKFGVDPETGLEVDNDGDDDDDDDDGD